MKAAMNISSWGGGGGDLSFKEESCGISKHGDHKIKRYGGGI